MNIRARIGALVVTLTVLVVASITANLVVLEQRRVRRESAERVSGLLENVQRIARESLSSFDDLMLLSYLKFLMRDYPELELAVVSRQGHTSVLGSAKGPLDYRTLTVTEESAADLQPVAVAVLDRRAERLPGARQALPPHAVALQVGFSKEALERRVRDAQTAVAAKVLGVAGFGLLVGLVGSVWVAGRISRPVMELDRAAKMLGEGRLDVKVPARGRGEIASLGRRFNAMAARIRDLLRSKDDLMSTLSHELNTPLAGVKGYLGYLRQGGVDQDPAERGEAYDVMAAAVQQMETSLKNALFLFQTGAQPALKTAPTSLNAVVNEVLRLFGPTARIAGLELAGPQGGPEVVLDADPEMLRRVVINLVSNAIKYTPSGGRVAVEVGADEAAVRLSVSDTGPGISAEDRERIFTRFYRVEDADGRRRRIPGSGLGLAIAKQAVELHGGSIWVESEPGRGSVFQVLIPRKISQGKEAAKPPEEKP